MSKIMKLAQRLIFVICICVCLSYSITSADQQRVDAVPNDSTNFSYHSNQSVSIAASLAGVLTTLSLSLVKGEPLLLLLFGIAMFIGATTVKKASDRKRSSLR